MKPQFTEEEASIFCIDMQFSDAAFIKHMMRNKDYIRKSDLEILIEECDERHRKYRNIGLSIIDSEKFLDKLLKLVEMLKSELNKRRDK